MAAVVISETAVIPPVITLLEYKVPEGKTFRMKALQSRVYRLYPIHMSFFGIAYIEVNGSPKMGLEYPVIENVLSSDGIYGTGRYLANPCVHLQLINEEVSFDSGDTIAVKLRFMCPFITESFQYTVYYNGFLVTAMVGELSDGSRVWEESKWAFPKWIELATYTVPEGKMLKAKTLYWNFTETSVNHKLAQFGVLTLGVDKRPVSGVDRRVYRSKYIPIDTGPQFWPFYDDGMTFFPGQQISLIWGIGVPTTSVMVEKLDGSLVYEDATVNFGIVGELEDIDSGGGGGGGSVGSVGHAIMGG